MNIEFKEKSGFPIWINLIVLCPILVAFVILVTQKAYEGLFILVFVEAFSLIFFNLLRLNVCINQQGISYSFFPFISTRTIKWENIKEAKIVHYDPLWECGGWGMRYSKKYGKVYNTQGDIGLSLITTNDEKYLLGILDEKNANGIIEKFFPKNNLV